DSAATGRAADRALDQVIQGLREPSGIARDGRRGELHERVKLELLGARERAPSVELAREQRDEIERFEAQLEAARRHLRRVVEIVDEPRLPSEVPFDGFDGL